MSDNQYLKEELKNNELKKTNDLDTDNNNLVRRMRLATFVAPFLLFILMLFSFFVLQNFLLKQQNDTTIVNISGRQRMLSQHIAKSAAYLAIDEQEAQETHIKSLKDSINLFKESHQNLIKESKSLGFNDNYTISEKNQLLYASVKPFYEGIITGVENTLIANKSQDSSKRLQELKENFIEIKRNEKAFLPIMNAIVFNYNEEGQEKIFVLRVLQGGVSLLIMLFTISLAVFGMRPMVSRVKMAFLKVEEANAELATQNEELEASEEEIRQNAEQLQSMNEILSVTKQKTEERQKQLQSLSDNLQGIMFRAKVGKYWTMDFISSGVQKLTGYPATDFLREGGRILSDSVYKKDHFVDDRINEAIANKKTYQIEYRLVHKDKSVFWVEETGTPIFDINEKLIYIDGVIMNISARKKSHNLIEEQKQLLQEAEQMAKMGSYVWDTKTNEVRSSENLPTIYGFPKEKLLTKDVIAEITHPQDLLKNKILLKEILQLKRDKSFVSYRARINQEQDWKHYHSLSYIRYDKAGLPLGVIGTVQDVTEEVLKNQEMEKLLHDISQSNDYLDEAQRLAKIVSYDTNIQSRKVVWSASFSEVFEISSNEIPKDADSFNEWIEEEYLEQTNKNWQEVIENNKSLNATYCIKSPKGRVFCVRERGYPVFDEAENIIAIRGTLQDITEVASATRQLEQKSKQIEKQNEKFIGSINYAQRIQSAMLGGTHDFKNLFQDGFIFFEPKDIVSGDFYWYSELNENKKIAIVADCTGHGVPGAFMSLLGTTILNEIILQRQISKPNIILDELQKQINHILKQESTGNRDGMDVAIVVLDKSRNVLEFAGAKNPLVYIHKEHKKGDAEANLTVIKGDNLPIGGRKAKTANQRYKNHTIDLDNIEAFYIYSDGFQDQFGGEEGMKFMSTKFRELLYNTHGTSMRRQRVTLKRTLMDWMGTENEQIDDICVMGVTV